jgi:RNA polymerase sigma-70 factor, ECF subfamily
LLPALEVPRCARDDIRSYFHPSPPPSPFPGPVSYCPPIGAQIRFQRPEPHLRNTNVTDAELASLAASGDGDAFGTLVERYAPVARRVVRVLLPDPADTDDAVQEGLISAWRAIERFDVRRPFRPWLLRIVLNAARDALRRRKVRRAEPIPDAMPAPGASPERFTERSLLRGRLDEVLAALPERQRVAVTLFDAEGYAHAEIAALLEVPEGTVRSDVFHARRALRLALAPFLEDSR